jgi:hypothetical protein
VDTNFEKPNSHLLFGPKRTGNGQLAIPACDVVTQEKLNSSSTKPTIFLPYKIQTIGDCAIRVCHVLQRYFVKDLGVRDENNESHSSLTKGVGGGEFTHEQTLDKS